MAGWLMRRASELAKTVRSLVGAVGDWIDLNWSFEIQKKQGTFAFLVHPRTGEFYGTDVYGENDIFRPFPALYWLNFIVDPHKAERAILWFAKRINPIKLSRIKLTLRDGTVHRGYLLSTVRTPQQLFSGDKETRRHLSKLFSLAGAKGVERVGLGALLPAVTRYGALLSTTVITKRPAISTGHAYTGYVIVDYLKMLVRRRNGGKPVVRVAIMGAAGSTGKAVLRNLMVRWTTSLARIELTLVDLPEKEHPLMRLVNEARECGKFVAVHKAISADQLRTCEYVICVTNSTKATILPEHVRRGMVIIDDSQPRNTTPALKSYGVHVLDVLARVKGLDVGFDFGFQTRDKEITFTCLAETAIAAAVGVTDDLAVGEVTTEVVQRTIDMVRRAEALDLVGHLPFVSFGKELAPSEVDDVFEPEPEKNAPSAP